MEPIYYAAAGTLLLTGFTYLFVRFINSYNRWKYTTKDIRSGWRINTVPTTDRKPTLRISRYNEGYPAMKKEAGYQVRMNSHLL